MLRLPKEALAYMLAWIFVFLPSGLDMLEAFESFDMDMMHEFAKKDAIQIAKILFGGGKNVEGGKK